MAATALVMPWWEWQDNVTAWTSFFQADVGTIERLYSESGGQIRDTTDLSWNRGFNSMYRYDFRVMKQTNLESGKPRMLRRLEVPCCPNSHRMEQIGKSQVSAVCHTCRCNVANDKHYHCRSCNFFRCLRCQGEVLQLKSYANLSEWRKAFRSLSLGQVDRLRSDVAVRAQLERESLQVVWRQWVDNERTFASDEGKNTTDIALFAMAPQIFRTAAYGKSDDDFVVFPAIRAPNYSDEVDVVGSTGAVLFDAKDRQETLWRGITLSYFLEHLGDFIPDLGQSNWADTIDDTPLQTSSQFSIIPAPTGCADVGIAAFGNQCVNLHIVIGPSGDLGWATEKPGAKRIFFRDASGQKLHAISLVPEEREEVRDAFFKLETHDETVEEEKQRYEKVENRLIHIQVTMDGVASVIGATHSGGARGNICPSGHPLIEFTTPHFFNCDLCGQQFPAGYQMYGCRPCDFDHCEQCFCSYATKGEGPKTNAPLAPAQIHQAFPSAAPAMGGCWGDDLVGELDFLAPPTASCAYTSGHMDVDQCYEPTEKNKAPPSQQQQQQQFSAMMPMMGSAPMMPMLGSAPMQGGTERCGTGAAPMTKQAMSAAPAPRMASFGGVGAMGAAPAFGGMQAMCAASAAPPPGMAAFGGMQAMGAAPAPSMAALGGREAALPKARGKGSMAPAKAKASLSASVSLRARKSSANADKKDSPAGWAKMSGQKKKTTASSSRAEDLSTNDLLDALNGQKLSQLECESMLQDSRHDNKKESNGSVSEDDEGEQTMESGLLLAVVKRGAEICLADGTDKVPRDARRKAGVSVRVTFMYYGLAGDGQISAERARRFTKQANFRRRELGLPHGSLVSGLGSWGGPENCPIKLFGFRLMDAVDGRRALQVIEGVSSMPLPSGIVDACRSLLGVVASVQASAQRAEKAAQGLTQKGSKASHGQIAALYLYTMETAFYRQLNAAMRDEDRSKAQPYFGYLKLLFSALETLQAAGATGAATRSLYRGVGLDLSADHPEGSEVVWWGASSCTPKLSVAQGFLGCSGKRTLFHVRHRSAVPIKAFSAFRGEEEWLLAPGTRLTVQSVVKKGGGLTEVTMAELEPPRAIR